MLTPLDYPIFRASRMHTISSGWWLQEILCFFGRILIPEWNDHGTRNLHRCHWGVEITNTRALSQFLPMEGIVATNLLSPRQLHQKAGWNYCSHCRLWSATKKQAMEACPFNSLYWHFFTTGIGINWKKPKDWKWLIDLRISWKDKAGYWNKRRLLAH